MAFALVAAASATNASSGVDTTTAAINTTGASLLVCWINYDSGTVADVNDSKGNTWTPATEVTASATADGRFYYCLAPTSVGTSHTATANYISGSGSPAIWFGAFSVDAGATLTLDGQSGTSGASPGSVTPSVDNCLLVAGCSNSSGAATAVGSSFTLNNAKAEAAWSWGVAGAYQIQTTATARNPTFSGGGGTYWCAGMIVIRYSVSGGPTVKALAALGVG